MLYSTLSGFRTRFECDFSAEQYVIYSNMNQMSCNNVVMKR